MVAGPPKKLTVLYDPACPLCRRCRDWLAAQPKLVPLAFLPQGTAAAQRRYPGLNVGPGRPAQDLVVVSERGHVYRNTHAWIMCFYALRAYRPLAFRLSHPALAPLARRAYQAVARRRMGLSRWFGTTGQDVSNHELADRIKAHTDPAGGGCHGAWSPPGGVR